MVQESTAGETIVVQDPTLEVIVVQDSTVEVIVVPDSTVGEVTMTQDSPEGEVQSP